jgi:hypothetical protein
MNNKNAIGVRRGQLKEATACRLGRVIGSQNFPENHQLVSQSPLKAKLLEALKLGKPDIGKDYLYERCVDKYMNAMLPALRAAIAIKPSDELTPDQFYFCQSKIREVIGTIGKQQHYIYQLMKDNDDTSLIVIEHKGFSKNGVSRLSTAKLNPLYEEFVIDEILNLRVERNQQLLDEIDRTANYWVPVEPASLQAFITKTTETLRATKNGANYEQALLRNLAAAQQLQAMIREPDAEHATHYVNERWEIADCGRIYGQGYSLQRMPKEVRHAALGVCHKYDFKASAFALMAGLAHEIDPSLRIAGVLDYIKNRQKIRQHIAKQLDIDESLVKQIFTAIGFGADLKNNQHNAIRGALAKAARQRQQHDPNARLDKDVYNNLGEDEFQRLIANQTFRYIYDALQAINATILSYLNTDNFEIGDNTYSAIDPKTGKKRTGKQKLAWIYQALESYAMLTFADLAKQEPLLTTHDCIYFKQPLTSEQVIDITLKLQETFTYLRFEHERIYPLAGDPAYEARLREEEEAEREHRLRIEAETERAKHYMLRFEPEQIYPLADDEECEAHIDEFLMDEYEQNAWLREQESLAMYHRITNKIRKVFDSLLSH